MPPRKLELNGARRGLFLHSSLGILGKNIWSNWKILYKQFLEICLWSVLYICRADPWIHQHISTKCCPVPVFLGGLRWRCDCLFKIQFMYHSVCGWGPGRRVAHKTCRHAWRGSGEKRGWAKCGPPATWGGVFNPSDPPWLRAWLVSVSVHFTFWHYLWLGTWDFIPSPGSLLSLLTVHHFHHSPLSHHCHSWVNVF